MPIETLAPSAGHEMDVALALIDTSAAAVSSGIPTLLTGGSAPADADEEGYVALGCTRDINITLPSETNRPIPCKRNPARWMVPGMDKQGELRFGNMDFPDSQTDVLFFNGKRTVAKVTMARDPFGVVRSIYCVDWTPTVEIVAPEGEGEVTLTASGQFSRAIIEYEDIS